MIIKQETGTVVVEFVALSRNMRLDFHKGGSYSIHDGQMQDKTLFLVNSVLIH
jgi:hypothetical protein